MVFSMCPICGDQMQGLVTNEEEWYAARYPGVPVGSLVAATCPSCLVQINVGDVVELRETRAQVVVHRIVDSPIGGGSIYFVSPSDGREKAYIRAQLYKQGGGRLLTETDGKKREGYF